MSRKASNFQKVVMSRIYRGSPSELTGSGGFYKRMQDLQQGALGWNL